jgi:hypothetical protein
LYHNGEWIKKNDKNKDPIQIKNIDQKDNIIEIRFRFRILSSQFKKEPFIFELYTIDAETQNLSLCYKSNYIHIYSRKKK